jgi:hypothetical protein
MDPGGPAAQLAGTDVLFTGRVVATRRAGRDHGRPVSETVFLADRVLKGQTPRRVAIRHLAGDSSLCGLSFERGRDHVVLARRADGRLWTGACSRAFYPLAAYEAALAIAPHGMETTPAT